MNTETCVRPGPSRARNRNLLPAMREALDNDAPRREPLKTLKLAQRALTCARGDNNPESIVQCLQLAARSNTMLGKYDEALQELAEAAAISSELGNEALLGESLFRTSIVYSEIGDLWKTLELCMQSLHHFEATGDAGQIARAYATIGTTYSQLGILSMALEYLQRSLQAWENAGDMKQIGPVLGSFGSVHAMMKEWDMALEYHQRAMVLAQKAGDKPNEATALAGIGGIYIELGNHHRALWHFRQALAINKEIGHRLNEASVLTGIGLTYRRHGNHSRALGYYRKALALIEKLAYARLVAPTLLYIGAAHMHLDQLSEAMACGLRALAEAERTASPRLQAHAHHFISDLHGRSGHFEKALEHYKAMMQIREHAEREKNERMMAWLRSQLELDRVRAEREMLDLKNKALELEVKNISRELSALSLQVSERNQLLAVLKSELLQIAQLTPDTLHTSLERFIDGIDRIGGPVRGWGLLMEEIDATQEPFMYQLARDFSSLTPMELKICSLLHMNVPNQEIAELLSLSIRSVEDHRYQIRKKLCLGRNVQLTAFLAAR